jgi:hypothetical protein
VTDAELLAAVQRRGYQPARADVDPLLARLARPDDPVVRAAERALARLGMPAAQAALARFADAAAPLRGNLCRLVGRVATEGRVEALRPFLLERLADPDPKTRRNAVIALGKLGGPDLEPALLERLAGAPLPEQRSLVAALGKVGGSAAHARLSALAVSDAELERIRAEALLKLERTRLRQEGGSIDLEAAAPGPLAVVAYCRQGLEELVAEELAGCAPRRLAAGRVALTLDGPLASLYRSRTLLFFAFPLPVRPRVGARASGPDAQAAAVVEALTGERTLALVRAFTRGPVRYRIEWTGAGHRRGLTYAVARAVAAARPELVNDPTSSLWEARVEE